MGNLKIVSVGELRTAKDDRQFFSVEFRQGLGKLTRKRQIFEDYVNDPKTGLPTDKKTWKRGSREEYIEAMNAGEKVEGDIVTSTVETYFIEGNETPLNTYTCVIFGDEKPAAVFAASNHPMVDEQGVSLDTRKKKVLISSGEPKVEPADVAF